MIKYKDNESYERDKALLLKILLHGHYDGEICLDSSEISTFVDFIQQSIWIGNIHDNPELPKGGDYNA